MMTVCGFYLIFWKNYFWSLLNIFSSDDSTAQGIIHRDDELHAIENNLRGHREDEDEDTPLDKEPLLLDDIRPPAKGNNRFSLCSLGEQIANTHTSRITIYVSIDEEGTHLWLDKDKHDPVTPQWLGAQIYDYIPFSSS